MDVLLLARRGFGRFLFSQAKEAAQNANERGRGGKNPGILADETKTAHAEFRVMDGPFEIAISLRQFPALAGDLHRKLFAAGGEIQFFR